MRCQHRNRTWLSTSVNNWYDATDGRKLACLFKNSDVVKHSTLDQVQFMSFHAFVKSKLVYLYSNCLRLTTTNIECGAGQWSRHFVKTDLRQRNSKRCLGFMWRGGGIVWRLHYDPGHNFFPSLSRLFGSFAGEVSWVLIHSGYFHNIFHFFKALQKAQNDWNIY